jgi:hypothetical protein
MFGILWYTNENIRNTNVERICDETESWLANFGVHRKQSLQSCDFVEATEFWLRWKLG